MKLLSNFCTNKLGFISYGNSYLVPISLPWREKKNISNTSSFLTPILKFLKLDDFDSILEDGRIVLILGPHWPGLLVTFGVTYFSHHVHSKLISKLGLDPSSHQNYMIFLNIMCFLILISLLFTSFVNPGIYFHSSLDDLVNNTKEKSSTNNTKNIDEENEPMITSSSSLSYRRYDNTSLYSVNSNNNMKYCEDCRFQVCSNYDHCNFCGYCIEDLDHHCPWIGQCIGKKNYRLFIIFNVMWLSLFIESMFLIVYLALAKNRL